MPATLTSAMLADLHIGNAALSLKAYPAAGVDLSAAQDFSGADQIFTLEGTFNLTNDDASGTEIRIDQHQKVIDTNIEKGGNWRMTGNIPSQASELLEYFFTEGASSVSVTGAESTTYSGKAFFETPEVIEVSVLAESESKNTAILFPHVKMVVSAPRKDDNTNPLYLSFVGFILPNGKASQGDFVVLKAASA